MLKAAVPYGKRLSFHHLMYRIVLTAKCTFWPYFIFLLLVFRKFLEPIGHFVLAMNFDVRDGFSGPS
jgi:hypothetical protein